MRRDLSDQTLDNELVVVLQFGYGRAVTPHPLPFTQQAGNRSQS